MKNLLYSYWLVIFFVMFCSCKRSIKGEGAVVTETRDITDATEIELSIPAIVNFVEADSFSCAIAAQKNILESIKTKVSGGELTIESDKNFNINKPVQIVISLPKISAITLNGSGEISGINNLHDKQLELELNGSGKIKLSGKILDIESVINGSGEIYIKGKCDQQKISINGSGDFHGYELESANSRIEINGSGDAEVNVSDELKANLTGSGNIRYKGNPHIKSDITGSGNVQKIE